MFVPLRLKIKKGSSMMKKSFFVLLLAVSIAFAALAFSVQADNALQLSVSASGGDYTTVEAALSAVETMAAKGELNAKGVKLVLTGTHTATVQDGILFGQKTVFLPDGQKLPITITGGTLNLPAQSVACTNDYTFTDITIPLDDVQTKLYAGTGDVVLGKITMDLNGSAEYKSRFYGDNFTAKAFEGWDESKLSRYTENGLFTSSVTLTEGFVYKNTSAYPYASVGSSTDFSATVGSKTVSADDTCAKLIIDGATVHNTMVRAGANPVGNSVLEIKSGTLDHVYAATGSLYSTSTGDITVIADGANANVKDFPRFLNGMTLNGNLNVTLKNVDLMNNTVENGKMIQLAFNGVTVNGNVTASLENVKADRFYTAFSCANQEVNGNVSVTAKNCEFSKFFYGGFSTATINGNVENNLENVKLGHYKGLDECPALRGDLTTKWKNVSFSTPSEKMNVFVGSSVSCSVKGNFFTTLEEVTVPKTVSLFMGSYSGTHDGNLTSTVKSGTYSDYLYGANYAGTVKGTVTNNIQGGTYEQEVYLGGYSNTLTGQIINNVTDGNFHTVYLYGGTRSGKITNTSLDYTVKNTYSGGYFKGVWGGSGGGSATHKGNIYNEIRGGTFDIYNASKTNSFAGGCRNTKHVGNVKTEILGGTFTGYVAGGSIPNDSSMAKASEGNTELILAGGTFESTVDPASRWGTYSGETLLNVNTEKGAQPLKISLDLNCNSLIAGSDEYALTLSTKVTAKDVTAKGTKPLVLDGAFTCQTLTVENGAAFPAIYGTASIGKLTCGEGTLQIGAKTKITLTEAVGAVNLYQSELWCANTYFTSPASTEIYVTQAEDAFGKYQVKNGVVKGLSSALAGAGIIFSDRISLRFAFDKEWVESVKESFSFTAKACTETIVNGATYSDLILKDGYYTVLSDPINTVNYNKAIAYSGNYLPESSFTLTELAATGIKIYDKAGQYPELANLLKAFANYAVATDNFKNGKSAALPYENLATPTDFAQLQQGDETWGGMTNNGNRGTGYMKLTSTALRTPSISDRAFTKSVSLSFRRISIFSSTAPFWTLLDLSLFFSVCSAR